MKDGIGDINNLEDVEDIGLLDSTDVFNEGKAKKGDIFKEVAEVDKELKEIEQSEKDKDDDDDKDDYVLNDYGTSEIEESELIIDDMGEFERDDYWVDDEEGYEGVDIEDLS